ncbi:hypothetical protein D3C80_2113550 [compost metagenome]
MLVITTSVLLEFEMWFDLLVVDVLSTELLLLTTICCCWCACRTGGEGVEDERAAGEGTVIFNLPLFNC